MKAANEPTTLPEAARLDPALNPALKAAMRRSTCDRHPARHIQYALDFARQGYKSSTSRRTTRVGIPKAYGTVSGQNSNNSVRIPNEFFARLDAGSELGH